MSKTRSGISPRKDKLAPRIENGELIINRIRIDLKILEAAITYPTSRVLWEFKLDCGRVVAVPHMVGYVQ